MFCFRILMFDVYVTDLVKFEYELGTSNILFHLIHLHLNVFSSQFHF